MTPVRKEINYGIEFLRGFSALIVVFFHIINHHDILDINYFPAVLDHFMPPGHLAVMLFFVLSGYVIGITHKQKLTGSNLWSYLQRRFLRIYPIYCLAILFSILVAPHSSPMHVVVANLTLTQNIVDKVIATNGPAWSLNYEVVFYMLFIPVSFFNIKTPVAFILSLTVGTINLFLPFNPLITAYAYGFCFWLAGLFIARNYQEAHIRPNLPALLFYILGIGNIISPIHLPIIKKGLWLWSQQMVNINDLLLLPYCFIIVILFAGKDFKFKVPLFMIFQILPLIILYRFLISNPRIDMRLIIGIVYLTIAILLHFIHIPNLYLRKIGLKAAGISYGLYMIHFPLLHAFGRISIWPGNLLSYLIKVVLYLSVTLFMAWILEKKLQPKVKHWLRPTLPSQQL